MELTIFGKILNLENVHFYIKSTCTCCMLIYHQCLEAGLIIILFTDLYLHFEIVC